MTSEALAVIEDLESDPVVIAAVVVSPVVRVGCCVFSGLYPMNGSLNDMVYGDMLIYRAPRIWTRGGKMDEEYLKR